MSPFSFAILVINLCHYGNEGEMEKNARFLAFRRKVEKKGLSLRQVINVVGRMGDVNLALLRLYHNLSFQSFDDLKAKIEASNPQAYNAMGIANSALICFISETQMFDQSLVLFLLRTALCSREKVVTEEFRYELAQLLYRPEHWDFLKGVIDLLWEEVQVATEK